VFLKPCAEIQVPSKLFEGYWQR